MKRINPPTVGAGNSVSDPEPVSQHKLAFQRQMQIEFEQRQQDKAQVTEAELKAIVEAKRREQGLSATQKPVRGEVTRRAAARRSRGDDASSRRRRALNAMRALPHRLSTDIRFTDSFFIVLEFHYREADKDGHTRVSLPEITNRLKLSRSTVIRAHELLESEGLLKVNRRRLAADMNDTNTYQLGDELMKGRGSNLGGVRGVTPKVESIIPIYSTTSQTSEIYGNHGVLADGLTPDLSEHVYNVSNSTPSSEKSIDDVTIPPPTISELSLLREINNVLDPEQPKDLSPNGLIQRAEELIAEEIPTLYINLWRVGWRRHGFKAVIAVFETILLTRTDYVYKPYGYLWGILRKPRGCIAPETSLSRFMMQRRLPKALRLCAEGGPSVALPRKALPLNVVDRAIQP